MTAAHPIRIGTAGWSIPKLSAPAFPVEGTHLERTARVMPMTEVNSSFYRPHKPETWARWAASTPLGIRFAVKLPKAISHEARLAGVEAALERFLAEAGRCWAVWSVFDNTADFHAVDDALATMARLGMEPPGARR